MAAQANRLVAVPVSLLAADLASLLAVAQVSLQAVDLVALADLEDLEAPLPAAASTWPCTPAVASGSARR